MGARAQVKVVQMNWDEKTQTQVPAAVYLYTHWGSGSLVGDVAAALNSPEGRGRWSDDEYLTRIIFDKISEDEHGTETGFGIGIAPHGDIELLVTVDPINKTVAIEDMYEPENNKYFESFDDFIDQTIKGKAKA